MSKKNENDLSKDFQIAMPSTSNDDETPNDLEYENQLVKDIESSCNFSVYVDKLDIKNEFTDEELAAQKTKEEIISYKNDQIQKLKAYIASLEQEKEDLIDNFKDTTNLLLEKIKDFESNPIYKNLQNKDNNISDSNNNINDYYKGIPSNFNNIERPQTAAIADELNNPKKNSHKFQRCPNCQNEIPENEFVKHSLKCLRHVFRCKKCGELINENNKKEHIAKYRNKKRLYDSIKDGNYEDFVMILEHGLKNDDVLNEKDGDYIYHVICRYNRITFLKELIERKLNFDINKLNKHKETPLITAIDNNGLDCAKIMINLGCDVNKRNKGDLSPLMLTCKYGYKNIFDLLLSKGANINDVNILGSTALSIAQSYHHDDLAMILLQKSNVKFKKK